ncbi:unnamed protein product [Lepidochelys kempii]
MLLLRLIIFLQLADLVLMSTYNFSNCNHEAIKDAFFNVISVHLEKTLFENADWLKDQDSHGCGEKEGELLECIQNTIRCCLAGSQKEDVWTLTRTILNANCADYFPEKAAYLTQENRTWPFQHVECQESRSNIHRMKKRKRSQRAQPCEEHRLQELLAVLRSYMNINK